MKPHEIESAIQANKDTDLEFKTDPYKHQHYAIHRGISILNNPHRNYLALLMEMGTGKSKVSIDLSAYLYQLGKIDAVLLIAPNGIQEQWQKEQVPIHSFFSTKKFLWVNKTSQSYNVLLNSFINESGQECLEYTGTARKTNARKGEKEIELVDAIISDEDKDTLSDLFGDDHIRGPVTNDPRSQNFDDIPKLNGDTQQTNKITVEETLEAESSGERFGYDPTDPDTIKWFFVNAERFSTGDEYTFAPFIDFLKNHNVLMIVDEATAIKNPQAKRTKNIMKLGKLAAFKMALTGTPVTNSPFDVFSIMEFLKPGFWGCNYFVFKNRYGMFVKDSAGSGRVFSREMSIKDINIVKSYLDKGYSLEDVALRVGTSEKTVKYIQDNPDVKRPYKNLEKIKKAIEPVSVFVRKDECDDINIPDKIYEVVQLDMSKEQERVYKELRKNLLAEYETKELTVLNKVSLALRLQQITGGYFPYEEEDESKRIVQIGSKNPKLEYLKHDIQEAGDVQILIWARFVAEIEAIEAMLTKTFPNKVTRSYYGGVEKSIRNQYKEDFQQGKIDFMILNPQTGSMGLNMQNAWLNYIFSNNRSFKDRAQLEDRTHRIGQVKHPVYKDLIMANTIDVTILNALRSHRDMLEYFMDKDLKDLI